MFCQLQKLFYHGLIPFGVWPVAVNAATNIKDLTGCTNAYIVLLPGKIY
jgi:hypothetical protein